MKYLLIALVALLATGCSKNQTVDSPIRPGLKSMFNWNKGSYWLMQDSTTGRIDSFYLSDYSSKTYEYNDEMRERISLQLFAANPARQDTSIDLSFTLEYSSRVNISCFVDDSLSGSSSTDYIDYADPANNTNIAVVAGGKTYPNTFYADYVFQYGKVGKMSLAVDEPNGLILLRIASPGNSRTWTLVKSRIIHN